MFKICIKCQTEKPIEEFARDTRRPNGYQVRCRECNSEFIKEKNYCQNFKIKYHAGDFLFPKIPINLLNNIEVEELR